jgi:hypothetical protein
MDDEFVRPGATRTSILRDSGSLQQQLTLLRMYEYRQTHSPATRVPRGLSVTRRDVLRELLTQHFLLRIFVYTRNMGDRLSSGPVVFPGSATDFRGLFVYCMERVGDPAISIRPTRNGSGCAVSITCRRILCQALDITVTDLERWSRVPYPQGHATTRYRYCMQSR